MKSSKTSKKKSERESDDLEDMREAFRRHKERAKGGAGKNDWDKLQDGKNLRRVLPRPGVRKFYTEGWTHFNVGPNERAIRCIDEAHMDPEKATPTSGTTCPLCKKFLREQARINSEYQKGDEDGQAEWKRAKDKYVPRHQFYSNTLREDDDGEFEVVITNYGPQVWGQLMNYYLGDDTDTGDFTDPDNGTWMNIKKENKGGGGRNKRRNIEYKVFPVEGPDIGDAWDSIKEALHDLDAAVGKIMSAEEVVAVMKGIDVDKDSDDSASDDRSKRRSKRRDRDEDDEDEDEDELEDDDGEDDDDDDRPVKKSKLGDKIKKRRRDDD